MVELLLKSYLEIHSHKDLILRNVLDPVAANLSMLLWIFIVTAWIAFVLLICRCMGINSEHDRYIERKQREKEETK